MDVLVKQLSRSPRLHEQLAELNRLLERERTERIKFRNWLKPEVKAEFINGEIVMHSPAKRSHNLVRGRLEHILKTWQVISREGEVASEKALCAFPRNDYEPDIIYYTSAKISTLTRDTMEYPIPDFVVEVLSPSTEHRDRGVKFEDYGAHGVSEYWIVDPDLEVVEQYVAGEKGFDLIARHDRGELTPKTIPTLSLPLAALFNDEAHREFVATLGDRF